MNNDKIITPSFCYVLAGKFPAFFRFLSNPADLAFLSEGRIHDREVYDRVYLVVLYASGALVSVRSPDICWILSPAVPYIWWLISFSPPYLADTW